MRSGILYDVIKWTHYFERRYASTSFGTNCEFNYWLSKFETGIQDGNDYPPNYLTNMISRIQRQLRESGRKVNFFKKGHNELLRFRRSLDSRMNELMAAGVGVATNGQIPYRQ